MVLLPARTSQLSTGKSSPNTAKTKSEGTITAPQVRRFSSAAAANVSGKISKIKNAVKAAKAVIIITVASYAEKIENIAVVIKYCLWHRTAA